MKLAPAAARNVHMGAKSPRLGFLIHGSDCYFASDKSNYIHRYNTLKVSQGEWMLNLKGNVQMFNIQSRVYPFKPDNAWDDEWKNIPLSTGLKRRLEYE